MHFDKLIRPSVGADLSRPPPIYRPVMSNDAHGRIKDATSIIAPIADSSALSDFQDIPMKKLKSKFAPLHNKTLKNT